MLSATKAIFAAFSGVNNSEIGLDVIIGPVAFVGAGCFFYFLFVQEVGRHAVEPSIGRNELVLIFNGFAVLGLQTSSFLPLF